MPTDCIRLDVSSIRLRYIFLVSYLNESTYGTKSILLLSLAGFLYRIAELTLTPGFRRAAYFVLREGIRSVGRVLTFIMACVAADLASLLVSFWVNDSMLHPNLTMESSHLDIPLPVIFCGGFVGSFIVLAAAAPGSAPSPSKKFNRKK
jgi:hypothetical protein